MTDTELCRALSRLITITADAEFKHYRTACVDTLNALYDADAQVLAGARVDALTLLLMTIDCEPLTESERT